MNKKFTRNDDDDEMFFSPMKGPLPVETYNRSCKVTDFSFLLQYQSGRSIARALFI